MSAPRKCIIQFTAMRDDEPSELVLTVKDGALYAGKKLVKLERTLAYDDELDCCNVDVHHAVEMFADALDNLTPKKFDIYNAAGIPTCIGAVAWGLLTRRDWPSRFVMTDFSVACDGTGVQLDLPTTGSSYYSFCSWEKISRLAKRSLEDADDAAGAGSGGAAGGAGGAGGKAKGKRKAAGAAGGNKAKRSKN
jgi:hypothetical protein